MNSKLTREKCRDPDCINHWYSSRRLIQDKWDFTVNGTTGYKERECLCGEDANANEYYTTVSVRAWSLTNYRRTELPLKGLLLLYKRLLGSYFSYWCSFAWAEGIANRSSSSIDPWTTSSHTPTHILLLQPKENSVLGGIFTSSFVCRQNCKPGFCFLRL